MATIDDRNWLAFMRCFAKSLIAVAIVLLIGCGGSSESESPRVTLLVAASTTDLMTEFAKGYERKTGVAIDVAAGPSNGLARQILAGAPAEVFVSASPEWAETLLEHGLVERTTPLLRNRLVLIVPKGNPARIESLSDLMNPEIERVALAGENVPAGEYAETMLRNRKLFKALRSAGKIVRGHDVRVTLGFVERGEVAAGIVYATDARVSEAVEVVETMNSQWHPPIRYPAVLLKQASPEGEAFYEALISGKNDNFFMRYGFAPGSTDGENL